MRRVLSRLSVTLALVACSVNTSNGSADRPPVGTGDEAEEDKPREPPRSEGDSAAEGASDAGPKHDAKVPAPGDILGTLESGACGWVAPYLTSTAPILDVNKLTFVAGEQFIAPSLSPSGRTILETPNAGGSSIESEVMAFEVLRVCEAAMLLKTETQVGYSDAGTGGNAITDMVVSIDGKKVGVSVTRVYKPGGMNDAEVETTLQKKLEQINQSSARVLPGDKWVKQILHVLSPNAAATEAVKRVYPTLSATLKTDTIVLVTETKGGGFLYCNPDPALGSECPLPP